MMTLSKLYLPRFKFWFLAPFLLRGLAALSIKKDNAELLANYRPISTLPIFGKLFEKIIYSRLYSFFVSQNLLHEKQFGFRKNHSTSHAINYSITHINNSLKNKEHVLGIFIDLSKAFDTIDHQILLSKLETYGIRANAHSLITSYLSCRKQYVSVLGENSELLDVLYGVPQGSCLGPLLFLIYINDLCNVSKNEEFILFADDTNIFVKAKTEAETIDLANKILQNVSMYKNIWAYGFLLKLSHFCPIWIKIHTRVPETTSYK